VVILAWIGRRVGTDPNLVKDRALHVLVTIGPILVLLLAGYVVWNWKFRKREPAAAPETELAE
jgi:hypothetical protein